MSRASIFCDHGHELAPRSRWTLVFVAVKGRIKLGGIGVSARRPEVGNECREEKERKSHGRCTLYTVTRIRDVGVEAKLEKSENG